jgi:hypothetical protein
MIFDGSVMPEMIKPVPKSRPPTNALTAVIANSQASR